VGSTAVPARRVCVHVGHWLSSFLGAVVVSNRRWRDWDGSLKAVPLLYNQMSPEARLRLHAYLEEVAAPSSLGKPKLTNHKEQDDGIYDART